MLHPRINLKLMVLNKYFISIPSSDSSSSTSQNTLKHSNVIPKINSNYRDPAHNIPFLPTFKPSQPTDIEFPTNKSCRKFLKKWFDIF